MSSVLDPKERTQVKPRCASQRLLRSRRERLGMDRSRCPTEVQGARGHVPSTDGKRRSSPAAIAGFTFNPLGAIASTLLAGEPASHAALALFALTLLFASYILRRA